VEVELDRCWDLLRQRRARRSAGQDPDAARARDAATVEGYRRGRRVACRRRLPPFAQATRQPVYDQ
jgi:hypothetical protein